MYVFPLSLQPSWQPYIGANGGMLDVSLSYSHVLWPWSGWIAITLSVTKEGSGFTGEAAGQISLTISTPTVSRSAGCIAWNFAWIYILRIRERVTNRTIIVQQK